MPFQPVLLITIIMTLAQGVAAQFPQQSGTLQNADLVGEASQSEGTYSIRPTRNGAVLTARFGVKINGQWVLSIQYPRHQVALSQFTDSLSQTSQHK